MASEHTVKSMEGSSGKRAAADDDDKEEKRHKISFGQSFKPVSKKSLPAEKSSGLRITLNAPLRTATKAKPTIPKASVFNDESDEEPEEMPREAKMLMRNIGRDTPTSAGPNSFGKTKQGFCNMKKVFEKKLKVTAEMLSEGSEK